MRLFRILFIHCSRFGLSETAPSHESRSRAALEVHHPRCPYRSTPSFAGSLRTIRFQMGSPDAHREIRRLVYDLDLAFCAAHLLRCASAIRLRASALSTRFLRVLAGAFLVFRSVTFVATLPESASRERTCVSLAISASIWASIDSISITRE